MLITLRLLKQCFYQDTAYGPSVFTFDHAGAKKIYAYKAAPSDLDFFLQIFPSSISDSVRDHNAKKWPNKTTLSYIMNHKLNMNGMKVYHHKLSCLFMDTDHIDELIHHCDQYLHSNSGYSQENFQTLVTNLSPDLESELKSETFVPVLRQLSRIHAGAALAVLLLHATLHLREAADCISNYLQSPAGNSLLTSCKGGYISEPQMSSSEDVIPSGDSQLSSPNNVTLTPNTLSAASGTELPLAHSRSEYAFLYNYHYTDPIATFVGRKRYLTRMMTMLHDQSGLHHLFLSGISGIGKTELARKYAAVYRSYYRSIQMLHYQNSMKETICSGLPISGFDDSKSRLNSEELDRIFGEKLLILKQLFDDHCLLIIDNMNTADDPDLASVIELGFPLLITTQIDFSDRGYQTLTVHALESGYENASRNYLPAHDTGKKSESKAQNLSDYEERGMILEFFQNIYGQRLTESDLLIIRNILMHFSGHTFITELLARQMKTSFLNAAALEKILKEQGIFGTRSLELVAHQSSHTPRAVYDYISSIIQAEQLLQEEQYILKNLAILPLSGVPVRIFHELCQLPSYDFIWKLTHRSLIIMKGDQGAEYIFLHPLIQELVCHNLESVAEDYTFLFHNLALLSQSSWSKPKEELDIYHDLILSVLSSDLQYTEETLMFCASLLEFAWQYGHFAFVIQKCEEGLVYAAAHRYSHEVKGALCRVAGNCLYSAGLVYRKESTRWFSMMLEEYQQVNEGICWERAYALKNIARAKLNQIILEFGLKILPDFRDSFGYIISQRFSYPQILQECEQRLKEALSYTDEAIALLNQLMTDADENGQDALIDSCLSCKGDILFVRACILFYLHANPMDMFSDLDEAMAQCYYNRNGNLRSLSVTAAMTLKAKILMLSGDFKTCDQLLRRAALLEELYRGTSLNTHMLRIYIAEGDSAYLQNRPGNAHKFYGMARDLINHYEYLDKGRYYEEVSEKYATSPIGRNTSENPFYLTPGI